MHLTEVELRLVLRWAHSLQTAAPEFLEEPDWLLAAKIMEAIGPLPKPVMSQAS